MTVQESCGAEEGEKGQGTKPVNPEFSSWLKDGQACGFDASDFNSPRVVFFPDEIIKQTIVI